MSNLSVKPLEWIDNRGVGFNATTVVGIYRIDIMDGTYRAFIPGEWPPHAYSTIEAAKAAAQDHFNARILSALSCLQEPGEPVCDHQWEEDFPFCSKCGSAGEVKETDPFGYVCDGCGTFKRDYAAYLAEIRSKGALSCCPETNIIPIYTTPSTRDSVAGWQDISTAPKDGTAVFLYDGKHRYISQWPIWKSISRQPTHWQPLPAAPLSNREG